jgi:hypothetical protein
VFDKLKLLLQGKHAYDVIEEELKKPMGKTILLNGFKHAILSILAVAGASAIGYLTNDTALLNLLTSAGIPGFVAVALVPLLHSLLAMAQKKYVPNADPTPDSK